MDSGDELLVHAAERHCSTDEGKRHPGWGLPVAQHPLCSYQRGNGCRLSCTLWVRASVKITVGSQRDKTATEEEGEDGSKETKNRNIYKGNGRSGWLYQPQQHMTGLTDAIMLTYTDIFNTPAKNLPPNRIPPLELQFVVADPLTEGGQCLLPRPSLTKPSPRERACAIKV